MVSERNTTTKTNRGSLIRTSRLKSRKIDNLKQIVGEKVRTWEGYEIKGRISQLKKQSWDWERKDTARNNTDSTECL